MANNLALGWIIAILGVLTLLFPVFLTGNTLTTLEVLIGIVVGILGLVVAYSK